MKYFFSFLLGLVLCCKSNAQQKYWQQQVNYFIEVSLNDKEHSLEAFETIEYTNNSNDTLKYIWFHLWPNAYKNDKTAFAEQTLQNGSTKFYFSEDSMRGYINKLNFKVNNTTAILQMDTYDADIAKLILPTPLAPNNTVIITTPFYVQLPFNFSRGGHINSSYQITQWYPKPAVFDSKGWHEMPYLDQGEFYSEFGNFEVKITVPENYIVAATGQLETTAELEKLKQLGKIKPTEQQVYKAYHNMLLHKKNIIKTTSTTKKILQPKNTTVNNAAINLKTLIYRQNNCHDFAWFADKNFIVQYDTVQLNSKVVDVFSFYNPEKNNDWLHSITYAKDGLKKYSNWIGEYAYNTVSVIQGQHNENSGGMEYPTITLITTQARGKQLDETIVHEVGHNWFYGVIANNERDHAWMDEAINTYYQKRYAAEKYATINNAKKSFLEKKFFGVDVEKAILNTVEDIQKSQPIDTISEAYSKINYGLIVYEKGSNWVKLLEQHLSTKIFDSAMKSYYINWKFKHPYPEDFKSTIEKIAKKNIDSVFNLLHNTNCLEQKQTKKQLKLTSFFSLSQTNKYNYISLIPMFGFNNYDKAIIAFGIHNYQLPLNRLNFFVAPAIGVGSKQFNYAGKLAYNIYNKKNWLQFSVNAFKYTIDDFTKKDGSKLYQSINKIVPSIKYTLYNNARSTHRWKFELKSFIMQEDGLEFKTISTPGGVIDEVNKAPFTSTINQIKITSLNTRALYPYDINLTIDQSEKFIRAAFTTNYFFNYNTGKGGIEARLFAGKFIYTGSKTFITKYETDRYHLNMSGAKGYEDYTFSNYFFGRNEFEGWQSQQIMKRDGFFKVRTDLLSDKIGKTDNWLMALNFSGNVPDKLNILNAMPIKIPLKFFVDIGTHADAWTDNAAGSKFLYDAGLQVSLLKSCVNIYVPILYSKVYGNYFKSTLGEKRFWKTISFSIDIDRLQLNKLSRDIPL